MKVINLIFLVIIVFAFSLICNAQACYMSAIKLELTNFENKHISNAKVQVFRLTENNTTALEFSNFFEKENFYYIHLGLEERGTFLIKITAKDFAEKQFKVHFDKGHLQKIKINLRRTGTEDIESLTRFASLGGRVFDQTGALIPNAKIIVQDEFGNQYETRTGEYNGYYSLDLSYVGYISNEENKKFESDRMKPAKYSLKVSKEGFKEFEVKEFVFTNAPFGMNWEVVLELMDSSPGGAIIENTKRKN